MSLRRRKHVSDRHLFVQLGAAASTETAEVKEIVVLRDPPVVHVYDIIECGRRHFRSIAFSSDVTFCLHSLTPRVQELRHGGMVCRVMGNAARTIK